MWQRAPQTQPGQVTALTAEGQQLAGWALEFFPLRERHLREVVRAADVERCTIEFQRTLRIPDNGTDYPLPPGRQVSAESRLIVLSPVRTTPRGWSHLRAVLEFDGRAPELLADLAQSGGAILFIEPLAKLPGDWGWAQSPALLVNTIALDRRLDILSGSIDNLNRFTEHERLTVIDLVRAASTVPGVSVVATARTGLDDHETSWLPTDALQRLVRAKPITIGELSDPEIDQLRQAAPQLAALLADGHPAQQVARNLFRLSRLATRGAADSQRTEIDMARQWWDTADGPDNGRRERARVMRAVAEGALAGAATVNVDDLPPLPLMRWFEARACATSAATAWPFATMCLPNGRSVAC